ncbi:hypothetical protein ASZ90_015447 [hydrocarbon metagenome]|uniref:Uncharacterized protein n=1 Tax=hydrocarbon metagenome TaxID=938273 RepID=A0A0W8F3D4_9ZZZZ
MKLSSFLQYSEQTTFIRCFFVEHLSGTADFFLRQNGENITALVPRSRHTPGSDHVFS